MDRVLFYLFSFNFFFNINSWNLSLIGKTVACNSACNKFGTDVYCCAGAHDKPQTCQSHMWPKDYPKIFKTNCPDAYSYAYDDHKSTFLCKRTDYTIEFC